MASATGKKVFLLGAFAPSLVWFRGPLIEDLIAAGHGVIAAAGDMDDAVAEALRALGAEPVSAPVSRSGLNPFGDLAYRHRLERLIRKHRPDVVLTYTAKPNVWGALAAASARTPLVAALVTGLGYAFTEGRGVRRRIARLALEVLYRRALGKCDHVIFQNPDDRADFVSRGFVTEERSFVINGSGVDLSLFEAAPAPPGASFLMVARLVFGKGVREYAAAAALLKRRYPSASFRLVGWIDDVPDAVSKADLAEWTAAGVEFLGRLSDVRPALREASVYVLPSYREGTPRSVLEAMATGRAIVTTDAVGCRETVEPGRNGFVVPVRDVDALAAAMERFILDPTLATTMGDQSRRLAEEKYDVRVVNRSLMDRLGL